MASNVPAAWRRRGFHCRLDGRKTSKFAQTFGRVTAPLAPNRPLVAGSFHAGYLLLLSVVLSANVTPPPDYSHFHCSTMFYLIISCTTSFTESKVSISIRLSSFIFFRHSFIIVRSALVVSCFFICSI